MDDSELQKIRDQVQSNITSEFKIYKDGFLRFGSRLCIPNSAELKREIMMEAHNSAYIVHPGGTKMYKDLKENF